MNDYAKIELTKSQHMVLGVIELVRQLGHELAQWPDTEHFERDVEVLIVRGLVERDSGSLRINKNGCAWLVAHRNQQPATKEER